MPSLTQALGASTTQMLWIIDIYPLLMAGLLMPMGPWRTVSATATCCSAG
ncbi:major facilitator superfamily transporter [Aeromonas hydrophila 4AK4]|nr:major facilitator superfamily transporter [Aeromonas hydrophila 4AK4]